MPKFLEKKLKAEYGKNSDIPWKIMNKMGVMKGNKITSGGKAVEAKHEKKNVKKHSKAQIAMAKKMNIKL